MLIYTSADVASMGSSGTYLTAWRDHHERSDYPTGTQSWANALYAYWPSDIGSFNTEWQNLTTAYPAGVPTLASPKGRPDQTSGANALHAFCSALPVAWRPGFILAYWQEPGNDFGGGGQPAISEYRARVSAMADIVRTYGIRNAVHVEEWDINPFNNSSGSTQSERFAHLAQFVDGIEDKIDVVSWSHYPAEGNSMIDGIVRMEAWMDQYLPTHEWIITAASSPVNVGRPLNAPQRTTRANLVRECGDYIKERTEATGRGPSSFGWFHFSAFGGNNKDNLATTDQQLHDALDYVAALEVDPDPDPDPEPPTGGPVEFVGASQEGTGGTPSIDITFPAGVQAGDVALLFIDSMNNTVGEHTVTGWTHLGRARDTQNITSDLFTKVLTGDDSGDLTVSLGQNNIRIQAQMVVYRNVTLDGHDAQWDTLGGVATITTPTATATEGGVVVEHVAQRGNPVSTDFTPPAAITERLDGAPPPVTGQTTVCAATGDLIGATAGTVGGNDWTGTMGTNHEAAWTVALPATAPSGPTWKVRDGGAWVERSVRRRVSGEWVPADATP